MNKKSKQNIILSFIAAAIILISWMTGDFLPNGTSESNQVKTEQSVSVKKSAEESSEKKSSQSEEPNTNPEVVADYIDKHGKLPSFYLTKKEAKEKGWISSKGNLWEVTDHGVIGGDHFGNYEGKLPDRKDYKEADVNYHGGTRNGERLIFDSDENIYYTDDHYNSFEPLYKNGKEVK